MDIKRIVLFVALGFTTLMLWDAWQKDYPQVQKPAVEASVKQAEAISNNSLPDLPVDDVNSVSSKQSTANHSDVVLPVEHTSSNANYIRVKTDVLNLKIDPHGGNIVDLKLPDYPQELDIPNDPVQLFNTHPATKYLAQSGILGEQGTDTKQQIATYTADQSKYMLEDGQEQLVVNLHWKNAQGVKFTKSYTFKRGKYVFDVNYHVENPNNQAWSGHLFTQLLRKDAQPESKGVFHIRAYFGASYSNADSPYEKVTFKKMDKQNVSANGEGGWVAMQQHYFLSSWIPNSGWKNHFYTRVNNDGMYTIGVLSPKINVEPNSSMTFGAQLYAGPELPKVLKGIAPHLDMTVDYGWLWFISVILFWLMDQIHNIVGNWGWSIILVTVLIKAAFYRLSAASYRSMAAMRTVQPKILALRERYGDDRQKLSAATMELYRKEKVNPLGGCLPILVQIPVFIALYWVLIESVELRQAPFIFWIKDLSVKDPYYILPILMGISMFAQQKMNPPPPDPTQAKVMMMLPVVFTVLFLNFPSGLVLYWVVNNTLSILQQWYIMRNFEKRGHSKKKYKNVNPSKSSA